MIKIIIRSILIVTTFVVCSVVYASELDENATSYCLSATDPTALSNPAGAFFPGFRGADQLIKYTPKYGKYTGTNEYGSEITVIKGIVVSKTGSNSSIPASGFILSGHGKAKKWINQNLIIGSRILFNQKSCQIKAVTDDASYIYNAKNMISIAEKSIADAQKRALDAPIKKAESNLVLSKKILKDAMNNKLGKNKFNSRNEFQKSYNYAELSFYQSLPTFKGNSKGVWLRPKNYSKEDINRIVNKIADSGINTIYLETFYHGLTIFPSKTASEYGFSNQRSEFVGQDPLKDWLDIAHNKGLKVFVWFETFYVGTSKPGNILSNKPQWTNVQRINVDSNIPMASTVEPQSYFLDPANPEATMYLKKLISEIAKNYYIDGINLDYIRYPNSLPKYFPNYYPSTWGYSKYAREEFINKFSKDPIDLDPTSELWDQWVEYRQEKLNSFVSSVNEAVKHINPELKLSVVVFPNYEEAKIQKLQNWKLWSDNKYVDVLTPILLGSSPESIASETKEIIDTAKSNTSVYIGIFGCFNEDLPEVFLQQIQSAINSKATGINIFDFDHLNEKYAGALKEGPFRKK